ncbi:MAG: hypothetical protein EON61_02680 [Alphaproteobacteria bacterium]|nr:MAG: hypothetical protein EON61_02680 [Alphaproteobacteria bacterium]
MKLSVQSILLANGEDRQGALVFRDKSLVAVLSRLSREHGPSEGFWFLECAFGPLSGCHLEFANRDAAVQWLETQLET